MANNIQILPEEIIKHILYYVGNTTNTEHVSKKFYRITQDPLLNLFEQIETSFSETKNLEEFRIFEGDLNFSLSKKIYRIFERLWGDTRKSSLFTFEAFKILYFEWEELMRDSRLNFWEALPGGEEYLKAHPKIRGLEGKDIAQIFNLWMKNQNFSTQKELVITGPKRLIKFLPPEICYFSHLEKLSLNNLGLEKLSLDIETLSELTVLDVSNNLLKSLPRELGHLSKLKTLKAENNQLDHLPSNFKKLSELENLILSWNNFEKLPSFIGDLKGLKLFEISYNKLKKLPPDIGKLEQLESLIITHNQLEELPEEMGNLTSLVKLTCNENELASLPSSLGNLSGLVLLALSDNHLKDIPYEIGNIDSLRCLLCRNNKIKKLHFKRENLTIEI